MKRNMVK